VIFWGVGSLACGLSSTVTTLGASRLLLGFGMGMEFPVAQSMVSEIIPAERRGRYIAYLEGFRPLGFIASGLLTVPCCWSQTGTGYSSCRRSQRCSCW